MSYNFKPLDDLFNRRSESYKTTKIALKKYLHVLKNGDLNKKDTYHVINQISYLYYFITFFQKKEPKEVDIRKILWRINDIGFEKLPIAWLQLILSNRRVNPYVMNETRLKLKELIQSIIDKDPLFLKRTLKDKIRLSSLASLLSNGIDTYWREEDRWGDEKTRLKVDISDPSEALKLSTYALEVAKKESLEWTYFGLEALYSQVIARLSEFSIFSNYSDLDKIRSHTYKVITILMDNITSLEEAINKGETDSEFSKETEYFSKEITNLYVQLRKASISGDIRNEVKKIIEKLKDKSDKITYLIDNFSDKKVTLYTPEYGNKRRGGEFSNFPSAGDRQKKTYKRKNGVYQGFPNEKDTEVYIDTYKTSVKAYSFFDKGEPIYFEIEITPRNVYIWDEDPYTIKGSIGIKELKVIDPSKKITFHSPKSAKKIGGKIHFEEGLYYKPKDKKKPQSLIIRGTYD